MFSFVDSGVVVANSTSLALVTVATVLVGAWVWSQQKPTKNFPPGPKGWPLIGNITDFAKKPPSELFGDYAKVYGNIFSIRIGQRWTVVLNGAAAIKEALLEKGAEFANRPMSYIMYHMSEGGRSILFGQYNQTWKLHRKLAHSAFRTLATGDNERFEKLIYSILPGLTEHLDSKGSEPFDPKPTMASSIYNILATMCFGKQYEFDSPQIKEWMDLSREGNEILGNGLLVDFFPIFQHIPTPGLRQAGVFIGRMVNSMEKEIQEHREKYDPAKKPSDLIDLLFQARQEIIDEGVDDINIITDTHMRQTVLNVFGAGTDTSIYTLLWCIGLMVQHPDVQAKVAAEVDEVVGRERLPRLEDRENLSYTMATLFEVMRYSSLIPMAIPHATSKEVSLGDYTIPEGTWVMVNLRSMHYDEERWDEPQKFLPEHFMDEGGRVRLHQESFMPFSTGHRVCLGESVAKAHLFLLFAYLFQHYEFSKAPGTEEQDYTVSYETVLTNVLEDIKVVVKKRF